MSHERRVEDGVEHHVEDGLEMEAMFSAEHWDHRYSSGETAWSGNPNPQLVERLAGGTPGEALEAGAGDGSDAIWLAAQGWRVTAVDVSQVALDLGAERARAAGLAGRTTWRQADLRTWAPPLASYDLVTAMFLHLPELHDVHRALAAAVRPGGTLLIVLHHPHDMEHRSHWGGPGFFKTPSEIAAVLERDEWDVDLEEPTRPNTHPGSAAETVRDAIVLARRHPA